MGIFDFVKSGVREMVIARPEESQDLIYKHPDRTIPMFAQVTVRADEWAVFSKEGRPVGTLDAGRHTLQGASIPFLSNLIDGMTGGNILIAELFFVRRIPFPMNFGGPLGSMIDPYTGEAVRGRCHGTIQLQVTNPELLIYGWVGMGRAQDHPDATMWLTDLFFQNVKSVIGQAARNNGTTILDLMGDINSMRRELLKPEYQQEFNQAGVKIANVTKFETDIDPEDRARVVAAASELAQARRDIKKAEMSIAQKTAEAQANLAQAQVGINIAQAQAQANQFQLDQKMAYDKQYVQGVAGGNYGAYATGQSMMNASQGMAQGGGGAAGTMAQLGMGMGVAGMYAQNMGNMAQQFQGVHAGPGSAPPGMAPPPPPPPPPPPMNVQVVYHVNLPDGVLQVQGADAVRAEIARRGVDPAAIMVWTNGMPAWAPAAAIFMAGPGAAPPPPKM